MNKNEIIAVAAAFVVSGAGVYFVRKNKKSKQAEVVEKKAHYSPEECVRLQKLIDDDNVQEPDKQLPPSVKRFIQMLIVRSTNRNK